MLYAHLTRKVYTSPEHEIEDRIGYPLYQNLYIRILYYEGFWGAMYRMYRILLPPKMPHSIHQNP